MNTPELLQKVYEFFINRTDAKVSSQLLDILPKTGKVPAKVKELGILNHEGKKIEAVRDEGKIIDLLLDGEPLLNIVPKPSYLVKGLDESSFQITFKGREYKILGIERKKGKLNCTVRLDSGGKLHVDSLNLFQAASRKKLIAEICNNFHFPASHIKEDFQAIVKSAYSYQFKEVRNSDPNKMTEKDKTQALKLAKSPRLFERILQDYEKLGSIGEENNKLLCYIASASRLFEKPLSVMVISSSGAGKSDLVAKTLSLIPPEHSLQLTSLSAKALFYKDEDSLKGKVLSLEEDEGGECASYALRQLISSSTMTIESTIRDQLDGKIKTQQNRVNCQTAVFVTSTNPDTDPETKSRFFILHVDESSEQTRRIVELQKQSRGLSALVKKVDNENTIKCHNNFHRLLKPYLVVNPFIEELQTDDFRLASRRNFPKYLTLIDSICLLRQYQKEVKSYEGLEYLEVEKEDMDLADRLFKHVIANSTSDLCNHSRQLLKLLKEKFPEDEFSRKDIRDMTYWSFSKVQRCMSELLKYELVALESGGVGQVHTYRLIQTCSKSSEQVNSLNCNDLEVAVQV